jgi:hypothetical protein
MLIHCNNTVGSFAAVILAAILVGTTPIFVDATDCKSIGT